MFTGDWLVRQYFDSVQAAVILHLDIFRGAREACDAHPAADGVLPANNASVDKRVRLHLRAAENS